MGLCNPGSKENIRVRRSHCSSSPHHNTVSNFPVRPRLLVVDDEPLILEGLARLLATRDYEVVTANGGCEALIAIGKQQFDAILLDLGMPDLNGTEVLALRRRA